MQIETGSRKAARAREVSTRMNRRRGEILARWTELARAEIGPARRRRDPALLEHLPHLLEVIEAKLESDDAGPGSERAVRRLPRVPDEGPRGRDYEVADVLREFQILSRVLFDVLEVDGPLAQRERNMILRDIQTASYQAVEDFVTDRRFRESEAPVGHLRGWRSVTGSLLGVGATAVIQWAFWPFLKPAPYILFYPALILLALYAEGWTALAATTVVTQYLFIGEPFDWRIAWPGDYARQALLVFTGILIMAVRHQVSAAQARAYFERARSMTFARLQNALAEIGRLGLSDRGGDELIRESLPLVTRALAARAARLVPGGDGVVRIEADTTRDFSADEREFMTTAAGTLASALQRRSSEAELGRSNAELSRFAAIAAHDLKAPLNTITQFVNLVREAQTPDAETAAHFDVILRATDRMRNLVDRLLSHSRVGAIDAEMVPVDVDVVFDAARNDLDAAIRASGAEVSRGRLPVVRGDQIALQQLFQNLVGNALKFVPPGVPPRVRSEAVPRGDHWLFSVVDNGIGIDPAEAGEIFEPFRRLRARAYEGSGLGLAICRGIVERHGGKIWMESAPGRGSVFRFTLPREDT